MTSRYKITIFKTKAISTPQNGVVFPPSRFLQRHQVPLLFTLSVHRHNNPQIKP